MKKILLMLVLLFTSNILYAGDSPKSNEPVKMSKSKICHAPYSSYRWLANNYDKTKNFTPYKTLQECLDAGGRLPKR